MIGNNVARSAADTRYAPGPRGAERFWAMLALQRDPLTFISETQRRYGDVARFPLLGGLSWHVFHHPDDVERVLRTKFANYPKGAFSTKLIRFVTGDGIAASEGESWLRQRRLMQPAFHRKRLALLAGKMTRAAEDMVDRWDRQVHTAQAYDVAEEMTRLTLRVVGDTLFSVDMSRSADQLGEALLTINNYTGHRLTHPFAPPEQIPTARNRRYGEAVARFNRVVVDMITERQRTGEDTGDLLSMLIEARDQDTGEGMTVEQLRNEVRTLIIAGHETTAVALTWVWYLLAQHPDVEHTLHAELRSVLGGRAPQWDDLPQLPYTKMVIEEAMRLYPPAWIAVRQAGGDDDVQGYHVPKGSVVVYSPYVVHRHAAFWERPLVFDPEHFAPERVAQRHKFAYVPFSGGPRLCLGNHFTMMEMQLVLATIAQRYRLHVAPGYTLELMPGATLRPRHGMPMLFERR